MSKNLGNIMKQAQQMQAKMAKVQEELAEKKVEASTGGGMITVEVNGKNELLSIKIDKTVVDPEDIEMLEDLVLAAVNEGMKRAQEMISEEMGKVTSGLGIDLPGLF